LLGLKRRCERNLCTSLEIKNCLNHLIIADMHHATKLKQLALKFVVENAQELTHLPGWKEKITEFPDIFTEVFSALATHSSGKKSKSDDIGWNQFKPVDSELDFKPAYTLNN